MIIPISALENEPFRLFEVLEHQQLAAFVRKYSKPDNPISLFYWAFNGVVVVYFLYLLATGKYSSLAHVLEKAGLGFFLFLVILLPLHELIHGLVYRLLGARQVRYRANWRKFMFYAVADDFVVSTREFYLVALAPFVVINTALATGYFSTEDPAKWIFYGAFLLHTGGCSGDFALVSYCFKHRRKNLVTYDNSLTGKTFFYSNRMA